VIVTENDLKEARRLAWEYAKIAAELQDAGEPGIRVTFKTGPATYEFGYIAYLGMAHLVRDLCDEVEILRKPHVTFIPRSQLPHSPAGGLKKP